MSSRDRQFDKEQKVFVIQMFTVFLMKIRALWVIISCRLAINYRHLRTHAHIYREAFYL